MSSHSCPDCGDHAEISEELHELEAIRLKSVQNDLIWKKVIRRWAYRQNWLFPTRLFMVRNYEYEQMIK